MRKYKWRGINNDGQLSFGVSKATNRTQLMESLKLQGIHLFEVSLVVSSIFSREKSLETDGLSFIEQLTFLIKSKMNIMKALEIIGHDKNKTNIKQVADNCRESIARGKSLAETLGEFSEYFDNFICSSVNMGEEAGVLEEVLENLVQYLRKVTYYKKKFLKMLIYPLMVILVSLGIGILFLSYVIPRFETMFANFGSELPRYTISLINISHLIKRFGIILLISGLLIIWGIRFYYFKSFKFRWNIEKIILDIPLLGDMVRYLMIAKLTKAIGLMLSSGITPLKSIDIAETIITNLHFKKLLQNARSSIIEGKSISLAFNESKLFPNHAIQFFILGEESGCLDAQLANLSSLCENKLSNLLDNLNIFLEPLIILVLGFVIGSLIIGIYLPIFRLRNII